MSDGNVQDMAVEDKEFPALAATEEAQNMATLNRVVVPPPAYTDPNNPAAAGGSINLDVDKHPSDISEDYGQDVSPGAAHRMSVADTHADEMGGESTGKTDSARPEDRDEWLKRDWQSQAKEYGLATSGNTETVQQRVEEHEEAELECKSWNADDWKTAVEDTKDADELAELRAAYDRSGADYTTVVSAFDAQSTELSE